MGTKSDNIKIAANTLSKLDISQYEYEEYFMDLIKKYFVLTFVLIDEQYYEKLGIPECPEIVFTIVRESKKKNYG